ncbi:MAG: AAA family ATPase, partial [Desulfobacula sp.]|nr:AAA family ATPase [Desulfobacula sp.]
MMKRFALQYIEKWMAKKRRKPLIVRGARQTGKSTLVRLFAQKKNLKLNEVNLEKHLYLNEVFQSLDMNRIINELEAITGSKLKHKGSILFLDEIQATPNA